MDPKTKNILSFILRVGLSGILLWWLSHKIDFEHTVSTIKTTDVRYIFWAGMVFLLINGIILMRWFVFIKALELKISFATCAKFFFIGLFGNLFLPSAIGGDVIKILGLCKESSQKPKVVASVILDRLSGFAGMVVLGTLAIMFDRHLMHEKTVMGMVLFMAGLSFVVGFGLAYEPVYSFCCRIFSPFPKIKNNLMSLHYDIVLMKDRLSYLWAGIGISVGVQILLSIVFYFVAVGFHQDIKLIYFLIFVPLICMAASFPSIGGLGVREAGTAFLFSKIGVPSGIAVSISLISFLYMVVVGLMGGLVYVFTLSTRRVQHYQTVSRPCAKEA